MKFGLSWLAPDPEPPDNGSRDNYQTGADKESSASKSNLRIEDCSTMLNWRHTHFRHEPASDKEEQTDTNKDRSCPEPTDELFNAVGFHLTRIRPNFWTFPEKYPNFRSNRLEFTNRGQKIAVAMAER